MNNTAKEGVALVEALKPLVKDADCDVVVCVPAIDIPAVAEAVNGTNIALGAQNVHFAEKGAFTGEISANMLKEYGVKYVIIGHSERRQYFGETDETVNKRTHAALAAGLIPIVCIGETLEERETGKTEKVLDRQIEVGMKGIDDISKIVIAYEPVWAIGTGKTATDGLYPQESRRNVLPQVRGEGTHSVRRIAERGQRGAAHGNERNRRRTDRRRVSESARLLRDRPLRQAEHEASQRFNVIIPDRNPPLLSRGISHVFRDTVLPRRKRILSENNFCEIARFGLQKREFGYIINKKKTESN